MTPTAVLALEDITKRFGSTDALLDASLHVRAGSVHAVLGENGAGKTTLMRIAYGLLQPDSGSIRINGVVTRHARARDAIRSGLGMVHQHFTIVPSMTVAENVALGGSGVFDRHAVFDRVRTIGLQTGIRLDPHALAGSLGVAAQQQLEIVKALSHDARILILDEPTAVLAPAEADSLLLRLRQLAESGLSIVLITHKLREALAIADDVTVLRGGRNVLTAPAATVPEHELADAMLGSEWRDERRSSEGGGHRDTLSAARSPAVARATDISVLDQHGVPRLRGASLEIHRGEIVGVAGVAGSGVYELLRAFAGRVPIVSGSLDRPIDIGFVPEDRHRDALVLDLSLTENVALRGAGARRGMIRWKSLAASTRILLDEFDIRASSSEDPAAVLSGGNQQKLVLAREMSGGPILLVAENPTRGLDLRASAAVHARLRASREAGMAILLYSSDLDELLTLADRVFVTHGGIITETALDRTRIGQAMLGASSAD